MRRVTKDIIGLGFLLALGTVGCGSISKDLGADISGATPSAARPGTVTQGLLDAAYNLDQAVTVGALDATDPAPACVHGVLKDLGIDPANPSTPLPSFTPRVSDLISAGAVLYVRVQQAKRLQGGIVVPADCKALIGQFVMDAAAAGIKVFPGTGLLPVLR